jgi:RNA polymerase sigma-70 factor (ECF subfamily)
LPPASPITSVPPVSRLPPGHKPGELDDRILTALHEAHCDAVRRFVRTYVSDPGRAEDVVQETFLRAWQHVDRIDVTDGNPRSFLFTIARNVIVDQWRAQSRRAQLVHDATIVDAIPTEDDVTKSLERILINESLSGLSPEHRDVIKALYFDDLSVTEAAARLHVAVGTVKSRSYYAVRALRAAFDEMGLLR